MYTIGEFASIVGLSKKALRYYDEINLMKPSKVSDSNSYRYYSKDQINKVMQIKELKSFGLSLEDIQKIKETNNKIKINDLLECQLDVVERKIIELKNMKTLIEKKMQDETLWDETKLEKTSYTIEIIEIAPSPVVLVREKIYQEKAGELIGKLYEIISKRDMKVIGNPMMVTYYSEDDDGRIDTEVFIRSDKSNNLSSQNKRYFKGGKFLKTSHIGMSGKENAFAALYDYARKHDLKVGELIVQSNKMITGKFTTEIMFKIE